MVEGGPGALVLAGPVPIADIHGILPGVRELAIPLPTFKEIVQLLPMLLPSKK